MEEINVKTYGRVVTVVTYLYYMYENKRISKERLVILAERLADIIKFNNVSNVSGPQRTRNFETDA